MENLDYKLQEHLQRLEGGEPLEACLLDLPGDEALSLRKASALRTIASAAPSPHRLADQRRELLQFAKKSHMKPATAPVLNGTRPRWAFPAALAGSAFALFSCLLVFALVAGLPGLSGMRGLDGRR
jgi:hypothetical protein